MINKGFAEKKTNTETPNGVSITEKPLKSEQTSSSRVDINVLKSKLQENESKEFKRNAYILSSLISVSVPVYSNISFTSARDKSSPLVQRV